jgi:Anti-sigma-K factor rskA, C-terminal
MDHEGTREQLEIAALEPGGLDRLMAGDTPTAQAVAAHLAGCPSCSDELVRLGRASTLIRGAMREMPPADLRERTLAAIRVEGVGRPLVGATAATPGGEAFAPDAVATEPGAPVSLAPRDAGRSSRRQWIGWVGAIAAAVVLSVVTTTFVVNSRVDSELAAQDATIATLEAVTMATLDVTGEPDAQHVALAGTTDPAAEGSLVFSPSTAELVVVASGLTAPPAGQVYRCWVEVGGQRQPVGRMVFSDKLAYWVGDVQAVSGLASPATFGVSLVPSGTTSVDGDPVLVGQL